MSKKELSEEFVENIKVWLTLDDKIRETNTVLKELKKEKKKLHENVLNYMDTNNITELKAGNGKLKYSVSKTKEPLKYDLIESGLMTYFNNDAKKVTSICNCIFDNRKIIERTRVKRTFSRNTT